MSGTDSCSHYNGCASITEANSSLFIEISHFRGQCNKGGLKHDRHYRCHDRSTMCFICYISCLTSLQMDKSQSPLSKSGTPSPSHREALTPGAPGAPGPSTSCLRLVSKAASSADPLGETVTSLMKCWNWKRVFDIVTVTYIYNCIIYNVIT